MLTNLNYCTIKVYCLIMRYSSLFILFIVLLGFSACQEEPVGYPFGKIRLNIMDKVETRAMPDELTPDLTDMFTVRMVREEDNRLAFGGTCAEFNTKAQLFRTGAYCIKAFYGDNPTLAMDAPYYVSDNNKITIEAGKSQEVTLVCKVGNALASFVFENQDKLDKVLKEYYVEIVVGNERVRWIPGSSENPYFKAGSEVEFYLKGIWTENNQPYSKKFASFSPVEAGKRYNYRLKFDTSNMNGAVLDIQVDASVETVTVNQTLPSDWLPKPKITADGFDENNRLAYTETDDAQMAVINYTALRPIQDIELTLNFADPKLSVLNKSYLFSTMSETEKEALRSAAIILPSIDGVQTSGTINFTAMTSALLTRDGGLDVDNILKIKVKANDRWSDETTYEIQTIKPIFSIGVYPGNIWTKEFTANSLVADSVKSGDINRFKDISYEFSPDGLNWTALADDLRKVGLTPGATYYVRPKYRGTVPGEQCIVKTNTIEVISNSGMEQWYDRKLETGPHNVPFYEVWASGETDAWWTSNNARSTVYRQAALVYQSTTYPTVSKTKAAYSGTYAAEIRTIGCATNNAVSLASIYLPGMLFLGEYSYTGSSRAWDGTETITKGHSFGVKPTQLTFMYQYTAYSSGERFVCDIELRNQNKVLGIGTFSAGAQSGYAPATVNIDYENMDVTLPVDNIYVMFKSSTASSPTGKWQKNQTLEGYGTDWAAHLGSVLRVDNISLIYDK